MKGGETETLERGCMQMVAEIGSMLLRRAKSFENRKRPGKGHHYSPWRKRASANLGFGFLATRTMRE